MPSPPIKCFCCCWDLSMEWTEINTFAWKRTNILSSTTVTQNWTDLWQPLGLLYSRKLLLYHMKEHAPLYSEKERVQAGPIGSYWPPKRSYPICMNSPLCIIQPVH